MFQPLSASSILALALFGYFGPGLGCNPAVAQIYPSKPIRLIVPFPSGGVPDIVARVIAQRLAQEVVQPVVVDNRAGGAGTVGLEVAAKSPADGYTLALGTTGTLASAPALYPNAGYDPIKSFVPISLLVTAPFLVVIHPSLPANSLKSLAHVAQSRPGELSFGSAGAGGPPHIAGEMFRAATGVNLLHVPYKGLPTAVTDLVTGRIHIMFNQLAPFLGYIQAGKLKALAVAAPSRISQLPAVPTAAESGLPGYEVSIWFGLLAPAGTPEAVTAKLDAAVSRALSAKPVHESLVAQGFEVTGSSREDFLKFISSETHKWSRAIKAAGVKLD